MQRDAYSLFGTVALVALIIISIFIAITIILIKRILRPLNELAISADSIIEGKYDMQLDETVDAEIFALGNALKKTADRVSNYMNYINALAYRDALTGVKNVAAYNEMIVDVERRMRSGEKLNFAILVADINMLKLTNDVFGHEIGNQLIIKSAKIICTTFKHSPVFRIGGDEFVVMLENSDLENVDSLIAIMDSHCSRETVSAEEQSVPVSIARGIAVYNSDFHVSYADIFDRADREMYAHKSTVKGELEQYMAALENRGTSK
jgi:diguanylate cyclase (GGDEF)-like protein